jgi:hypothetical protein
LILVNCYLRKSARSAGNKKSYFRNQESRVKKIDLGAKSKEPRQKKKENRKKTWGSGNKTGKRKKKKEKHSCIRG